MKLIKKAYNGVELECENYKEFIGLCEVMAFIKTADSFQTSYDTLKNKKILIKIKDRNKNE